MQLGRVADAGAGPGVQNSLRLLLAGVVVGVVLGAVRDMLELRYPEILQAMKAFTWAARPLSAGLRVR